MESTSDWAWGINTARVSVGKWHGRASSGYTVIGDSVNLASRLEGATKAYGIAILSTQATLGLDPRAGPSCPIPLLESVKVKGKRRRQIVEISIARFRASTRAVPEGPRLVCEAGLGSRDRVF